MTDSERRKEKLRRKIASIIPVLVLFARKKKEVKEVVHLMNRMGGRRWTDGMVYRRLSVIVKGLK